MGKSKVAVITGDINASSKMVEADARQLEPLLKICFQDLVTKLIDIKAEGFTTFRGDSWQFVVGDSTQAVRATLLFRSLLIFHSHQKFGKKIQTSASIGFGSIDYLPDEFSDAGGGGAYILSGRKLQKLRRRMPGMGATGFEEIDPFLNSLLGLFDALIRHWTALQAQAVSFSLLGYSQKEISNLWAPKKITQQAVNKHLLTAGWPAINPALQWIETTLKGCIHKNNP